MKLKIVLVVVVVIAVALGIVIAIVNSNDKQAASNKPVSSSIPVGSTLDVAKANSKGALPACLAENTEATAAVKKDDKLIDGKYSTFDLAATSGIIDVPAGTNVDELIHSYDGKIVTGSIAYPAKYGKYNFKIVPNASSKPYGQWKMTYLAACKTKANL